MSGRLLSLSKWPGTGGGGGGTLTSANDGVSLLGTTVQLGQLVGAVGDPAKLLDNREIPFNGFELTFLNIGSVLTSFPIIKASSAIVASTPLLQFQNSSALEILSFRIPGSNSFFIGAGAGAAYVSITSGSIGIGNQVLSGYTTGAGNTAVGNLAMIGVGNGGNNSAFGSLALTSNTTGGQNVAFGQVALRFNTSGSRNTAFGQGALVRRSTANDNVAIGNAALGELLVATNNSKQNVAVGTGAAQQLNVGDDNVILGYFALFNSSGGNNNVIIGSQVFNQGTTIGDNCVFVGGKTNPTGVGVFGNNIMWFGANGTTSTPGLTNVTVIGQGVGCDTSNIAILGRADQNIILGTTSSPTDFGTRLQVLGSSALFGAIYLQALTTAVGITLDETHYQIFVDASGGPVTITLPTAASSYKNTAGKKYSIKKIDATANAVTIAAAGGDTIDGSATLPTTIQYNNFEIQSAGGTAWYVV